jgi:predicted dehydrogenase
MRIAAVCDTDKEVAKRASERWRIERCYSNFSEMLSDEQLSMVSILTPPASHASLAVEAITRGVNVMVEKPLTSSTDEAYSIMSSLKVCPVKLGVVYHYLGTNVMKNAITLMRRGELGKLLGVNAVFLQTAHDPMASNMDHWSHRMTGGRFGEMLPHPVYILQSVIADELKVEEVVAEKRGALPWMKYDELHISLRGGESRGYIYCSFNAPRDIHYVEIFGTRKILRIDLLDHTIIQWNPGNMSSFNSGLNSLGIANSLYAATAMNAIHYMRRGKGKFHALHNIYSSFLESIETNAPPLVTSEMAYNTVKIVKEICNTI